MSKKVLFWIFLILGIGWIAGVSYWYISGVENLDINAIKWEENFSSEDQTTRAFFKWILIGVIPLLVTALIFYCMGLFFGKNTENTLHEIEQENETLKNELAQHVDKIETMKVLYTGGKIERKHTDRGNTEKTIRSETVKIKELNNEKKKDNKDKDDLKVIEGIGERIEFFLNESGIYTWEQLSSTTEDKLRDILVMYGGASYKIHNPATWPEQAGLAFQRKWDELNTLKDQIRKSL